MNILKELNNLHDKWDSEGGKSDSDSYEDALYCCINDLGDLIIKYEKSMGERKRQEYICENCGLEGYVFFVDSVSPKALKEYLKSTVDV